MFDEENTLESQIHNYLKTIELFLSITRHILFNEPTILPSENPESRISLEIEIIVISKFLLNDIKVF